MEAISASTSAFFGSRSDALCKRAKALVVSFSACACFKRRSASDVIDVGGVSAALGEAMVNATGGAEGAADGSAAGIMRGTTTAWAGRILLM